jgi:hypothetical protein
MNETDNRLTIVSGTATTTEVSTITNAYIGTPRLGYSETTITVSNPVGMGYPNPSQTLTIANSNNMRTQQVHVAVFTVERNDKNEIYSTKFVKELWVEQKNGTSIDLLVAKQLDKEFDPETTVIRALCTVSF